MPARVVRVLHNWVNNRAAYKRALRRLFSMLFTNVD
jgi:hypothetical protein